MYGAQLFIYLAANYLSSGLMALILGATLNNQYIA